MSKSAADSRYVLDTSGLIAYLEGEPGADVVEAILEEQGDIFISLITLMEVRYLYLRNAGEQETEQALHLIGQLGLGEVEITRTILKRAAEIKARFHLSVADAIIAATAKDTKAVLVHRDPEYDGLADELDLKKLPPKSASRG